MWRKINYFRKLRTENHYGHIHTVEKFLKKTKEEWPSFLAAVWIHCNPHGWVLSQKVHANILYKPHPDKQLPLLMCLCICVFLNKAWTSCLVSLSIFPTVIVSSSCVLSKKTVRLRGPSGGSRDPWLSSAQTPSGFSFFSFRSLLLSLSLSSHCAPERYRLMIPKHLKSTCNSNYVSYNSNRNGMLAWFASLRLLWEKWDSFPLSHCLSCSYFSCISD